jgi:uncharacterized protein YneF (UPF0154 family)
MSKGVKIALVVVVILLGLCCMGAAGFYFISQRAISQAFTDDPAKAASMGHEIVDYSLPAGYRELGGMNALVFKMVFIGPGSGTADSMFIMLMQIPAGSMDQEEMQRQMTQAMQQQGQGRNIQAHVVGTQTATIKGQPVTLTVSEGEVTGGDNAGAVFRQVMGVFPGKGGTAMLMVMGNKATWDQATLDNFLASIK